MKGYLTPFLYQQKLQSINKNPTCYKQSEPKRIVYENCRKFNENNFNQDLHNKLSSEQPKDYASFEKIFLSILEEHAPV